MTVQLNIDDTDSRILYDGNWRQGGAVEEYLGTTHYTLQSGARAIFAFEGSIVSVVGTISETRGQSVTNFTVDGIHEGTYRAPVVQIPLHRQTFYQSPTLPDGRHTIVITATIDNTFFYLDYFLVTPNVTEAQPPNPSNPANVTINNAGSTTMPVPTPKDSSSKGIGVPSTSTGSMNQTITESSVPSVELGKSQISLGAAAGATAGGVLIFVFLAFLLWHYIRRRAREASLSNQQQTSVLTPFPLTEVPRSTPPLERLIEPLRSFQKSSLEERERGSSPGRSSQPRLPPVGSSIHTNDGVVQVPIPPFHRSSPMSSVPLLTHGPTLPASRQEILGSSPIQIDGLGSLRGPDTMDNPPAYRQAPSISRP